MIFTLHTPANRAPYIEFDSTNGWAILDVQDCYELLCACFPSEQFYLISVGAFENSILFAGSITDYC